VPQVSLADHYNVVEAFSADRTDQPLCIAILPRQLRGGGLIKDTQRPYATKEHFAVAGIPIVVQMIGRRLPVAGLSLE
jgi:hypothetical protein